MSTTKKLGIADIIGNKRNQVIEIAERHGASNIRVFGSVARGEATANSDVDFLVDQDWTRLSKWGGMELVVALSELLERSVDVATEEELKPKIKIQVLQEAIPL